MKTMLRLKNQQQTAREPQGGFTLLEVIVAMSILTIGILSTLSMAFMSVRNTTSGNIVTQATLLAQSRIEQIKNEPDIKDLDANFDDEADIIPLDGAGQPMDGGGTYSIAYTFTDAVKTSWGAGVVGALANCATGNNDGSGTCLASVTVTWQRGGGGRGGAGEVRLHTLTHGRGI
jgi:prepilin-type N-terminal cleavage/methylation domain-containing protein